MAALKCNVCGADLPGNLMDGLCPKCVLKEVLAEGTSLEGQLPEEGEKREGMPASTSAAIGTRLRYVGDYELLEEIAHGAMGVVYKARQISLDRLVAVKMIKAGQLATGAEVKRFQIEAEAAAKLDHPNIVAIHEVGEHEGHHYFSMRLVEGQSLNRQIERYQQDVRATAELLVVLARAVHHAHQRGILHRDIKPGNIIIDLRGEPHITDFGLAKRVDVPGGTGSETVKGTPDYMSPEQAQGWNQEMTTATDLWSLGATMYHLLAGGAPFHKETEWKTMRAVVEEEPASPRTLNARVDRELETICLKCLEKDPQRRYASADALAEDLERWLRREPIQARPCKAWERTAKWVRRKPVIASLAGALVIVALGGMAGILWHWRAAANEAEKSWQIARFLQEMLEGVEPSVALGRDTTLLREIVDNAARRVEVEFRGQPEIAAALRRVVGTSYRSLGQYTNAESILRKSLEIEKKLHGDLHKHVASSLYELSSVLLLQGRLREAEDLLRQALDIRREIFGGVHEEVAFLLRALGGVLTLEGRLQEAEKLLREAIKIETTLRPTVEGMILLNGMVADEKRLQEALNVPPANSLEFAGHLEALGLNLGQQARFREAEPMLRQALDIQKKCRSDKHPEVVRTMDNLALILMNQGKLAEAEALLFQAWAIKTNIYGFGHPAIVGGLTDLAVLMINQGTPDKLEAAEKLLNQALSFGEEHQDLVETLCIMAKLRVKQGNFTEAAQLVEQTQDRLRREKGPQDKRLARSLESLASALENDGMLSEAEKVWCEVLGIFRTVYEERPHPEVALALYNLANCLSKQGRFDEAEQLHREVLAMKRKVFGPQSQETANALAFLAEYLRAHDKLDEAEVRAQEALTIHESENSPDKQCLQVTLWILGRILLEKGKLPDAESLARRAVAINVPGNTELDFSLHFLLRQVLEREGKSVEAEDILRKLSVLQKDAR